MINSIVILFFAFCLFTFNSCKYTNTDCKSKMGQLDDRLSKPLANEPDTSIVKKNNLPIKEEGFGKTQLNKEVDCKECFEIAKDLRASINILSDTKVYSFLQCYNKTCFTNVELSEFGNELLYMLLIKEPELVLKVLSNNVDLSIDFICSDLENPLNEGIDVNKAYEQVSNIKEYKNMKERILKSIKIAIDKNKPASH